jgi:uncharacterized protein YbjT (DUF2867 family)
MSTIITGANGEFGRGVLTALDRATDRTVVATVRDVRAAEGLGVEVRP